MCHLCNTKPVYEFTNKRKLCKMCFIKWFQKKVLYIIRKFKMIKQGDVVSYVNQGDFRGVVLKDILELYASKGHVDVVKVSELCSRPPAIHPGTCFARIIKCSQSSIKKFSKLAISSTADTETYELVNELFNSKMQKHLPVEQRGKIIKPLYLFLDKEVLLYAKLKGLKFNKKKVKEDKLIKFVNNLEKKHPELKQAVVGSLLK